MSGYDFTNRPALPAGVYAHHLYTQWNIGQSDMLKSMVATGAVNLRDFNLNGAPLTGSISAASDAGSALHLSNHPDFRPFLHSKIVAPVESDWLARVDALKASGVPELDAQRTRGYWGQPPNSDAGRCREVADVSGIRWLSPLAAAAVRGDT